METKQDLSEFGKISLLAVTGLVVTIAAGSASAKNNKNRIYYSGYYLSEPGQYEYKLKEKCPNRLKPKGKVYIGVEGDLSEVVKEEVNKFYYRSSLGVLDLKLEQTSRNDYEAYIYILEDVHPYCIYNNVIPTAYINKESKWQVYCHEIGHMLGLWDLYGNASGDGNGFQPVGYNDMMSFNDGDHNAYFKLLLDWVRPYEVMSSCFIEKGKYQEHNPIIIDSYIIDVDKENVYEIREDKSFGLILIDKLKVGDNISFDGIDVSRNEKGIKITK